MLYIQVVRGLARLRALFLALSLSPGVRTCAFKVIRRLVSLRLMLNIAHDLHRTVVIAKLLYASPARWGYVSASDKQRIDAFIRRSVRLGFCGEEDPTAQQLAEDVDERLFQGVMHSEHHVLRHLLPDTISHRYSLRPRRHSFVHATEIQHSLVYIRRSRNVAAVCAVACRKLYR